MMHILLCPNIISEIYKEMKANKGLRQKDIYSEKQCKSIIGESKHIHTFRIKT